MGRTKTLAVSTPATTIISTATTIKIVVNIGEAPGAFIRAEKSDDKVTFYFHKHVARESPAPNHVVDFP